MNFPLRTRRVLAALVSLALVAHPSFAGTYVFKKRISGFEGPPAPWGTNAGGTGSGPAALSLTPEPIELDETYVDVAVQSTVTLTNTGGQAATAVSVGTVAPPFSRSHNCPSILLAGASCSIEVRFSASTPDSYDTVLSVTGSGLTAQADIVGTALPAPLGVATANPTSLTFASTQVDETSTVQTVTVTNTGNLEMTVSGVSMLNGSEDFGQNNNCGVTLQPEATCAINVAFTPSTSGLREGAVALTHDGQDGYTVFTFSGQGASPTASVTGVGFTNVVVNSNYEANAVVTNTGIGPLSIDTASLVVNGQGFSLASHDCPAVLGQNGMCTVTVRYSPTAAGPATGLLTLQTGAGELQAALSGSVLSAALGLSYPGQPAGGSVESGDVQVGQLKASQTFTLTNNGQTAATGLSIAVPAGWALVGSTCSTSLAVNASCTFSLNFAPTALQGYTGALTVTTATGAAPAPFTLNGVGVAPVATLTLPSFPATVIGGTSTVDAVLANTGLGPLGVTVPTGSSVTLQDFSFVSTTCASTLTVGSSCTVTLRFTPTSTANRAGRIEVQTLAGLKGADFSATASSVDYSADLSSYVNDQVAITPHPAWSTSMSTSWYSVNAGGRTAVPGGTWSVGKTVTVAGTVPVTARLRALADNAARNVRVNGVLVTAETNADYSTSQDTPTFTLYPGVNSVSVDIFNASSTPNPGGWVLQVVSADGASIISGATGWKYAGAAVPLVLISDGTAYLYANGQVLGSCQAYKQPPAGFAAATASGHYRVDMGSGSEVVYCDMTTAGGGWTLVGRSAGTLPAWAGCDIISSNTPFGWTVAVGNVLDTSQPYSMNVFGRNLAFTEVLMGPTSGTSNAWTGTVWSQQVPGGTSFKTNYANTAVPLGAPAFGMAGWMGMTADTSQYYFRDMSDGGRTAPASSYGLHADGWRTCYGNGPVTDAYPGAPGADYGGSMNYRHGMLMVR